MTKEKEILQEMERRRAAIAKTEINDEKKGACVYTAGAGVYCGQLTKKQCDTLKGTWYEGEKCPKKE